jgi:hypothetical protein
MNTTFFDEVFDIVDKKSNEHYSICAHIDLLGMKSHILTKPQEAQERIDSLHQGLYDSLDLHPGLEGYTICFYGDSISILKEFSGEILEEEYKAFCGNIFFVIRHIEEIEQTFGYPGLRVFTAHGKLIPLTSPKLWDEEHTTSKNIKWFILTGANEAFAKCHSADSQGTKHGFQKNHIWCESFQKPGVFTGVQISCIPLREVLHFQNKESYSQAYEKIIQEQVGTNIPLSDYKSWT